MAISDKSDSKRLSAAKLRNKTDDQNGKRRAGGHSEQDGEGKESGLNAKDITIELLALVGGIGFFAQAGDFMEFLGIHGTKPWCILFGFISVEFALAHLLVKNLVKKAGVVKWAFGVVVFVEIISVCLSVFFRETESQQPHFQLMVAGKPYEALGLTNEFLFIKPEEWRETEIKGVLVVPVDSKSSTKALQLYLRNDSPLEIEHSDIMVEIPKSLPVSLGMGWETNRLPVEDTFQIFGARASSPIMPKRSALLPEIIFKPQFVGEKSGSIPERVKISIQATGIPETFIAFWIYFTTNPRIDRPHLVRGTLSGPNTLRVFLPADQPLAPGAKAFELNLIQPP